MSILDLLGLGKRGDGPADERDGDTESVRRIIDALEELPPERARFVACFAHVLSRVANVDLEVSAEETQAMERLVCRTMDLPPAQAAIAVQVAKVQSRVFGSTDNYIVTRELNELADHEQKVALLACLFAVAASDSDVSSEEEAEIRKITRELALQHSDYIAARASVREHLSVLKDLPGTES